MKNNPPITDPFSWRHGVNIIVPANGICIPIRTLWPARINAIPASGATMQVFKTSSPWTDVVADLNAYLLTYANFNAGNLASLSTNWWLWASGAVTTPKSESTLDGSGFTAVLAISTGGTGVLEVCPQ